MTLETQDHEYLDRLLVAEGPQLPDRDLHNNIIGSAVSPRGYWILIDRRGLTPVAGHV